MASAPLQCLLVEDQQILQDLLVEMLSRLPGLALGGAASSAAEGISACAAVRPDLLILDFALPDADGLSVARALHVLNPDAKVIVLSSFASTVEWPTDLRPQLAGIIDKTRAFQDLLDVIRPLLPSDGATALAPSLDCSSLTTREHQVLDLVGLGLTSQAIADRLAITIRTVETHRHRICTKLGLSGSALVRQAALLGQPRRIPHDQRPSTGPS